MTETSYELVTVYRGRDSATYLASDFYKFGDEAKPLFIRQYPGDNKPYHKIELKDTDAIQLYNKVNYSEHHPTGQWNTTALRKLLGTGE